jgi:crotonobetainyl-CoA:carnitine CoA-transferase CaiB-like acyl-CoA transferase
MLFNRCLFLPQIQHQPADNGEIMADEQSEHSACNPLPLAGIRVLELGHNIMGPACGLILADLGAEVYKVERPGKGDDTRWLQGFGAGFFTCFNRNKKSLAINLKRDQGRELFLKLVEKVDVLIENFGPGTVDRLGIGAAVCRARNPALIFCSLKGFMPGPYAHRPALDEVVQMMGGLAYMTGTSGKPMRAGASVTDILSGGFGVIGILAALLQRQQTGQGQVVQASLFESVAFLMGQHMAGAGVSGQVPPPMPERGRTKTASRCSSASLLTDTGGGCVPLSVSPIGPMIRSWPPTRAGSRRGPGFFPSCSTGCRN